MTSSSSFVKTSSAPSAYRKVALDDPPLPWMHGAAGVLGGSMSTAMFYPLDLLRTRMHTYRSGAKLPLTSVREIVRQEGFGGMYRGMTVAVLSHSVGWGMYLTVFRSAQNRFNDMADRAVEKGSAGSKWLSKRSPTDASVRGSSLVDFLAACVAAVTTASLITPINLVKTRRQLHGSPLDHKRRGFVRGLKHIIEKEGAMTLLRGVGPQILLTGNTTIQVTLYEKFKRVMLQHKAAKQPNADSSEVAELTALEVALASAVSKATASAMFNPLEVVRTRMQDKSNRGSPEYRSAFRALHTIWRAEGVSGMYRGLPVNICRVIPTTVMAFVLYEKCLHFFVLSSQVHVTSYRSTKQIAAAEQPPAAPEKKAIAI